MKTFSPLGPRILGVVGCCLSVVTSSAKPPRKSSPEPVSAATPAPSPASSPGPASDTLARWLLLQNGSKDAIGLSLAEVIRAATGKNVLPVDPANSADAAMIVKIGGVMDRILPGMNRPESPAHVVSRLDEVTAFFEDALGSFNGTSAAGGFPAVRLVDAASGKSYYLGVTLYPTGGRDAAVRALRFDPAEAAGRLTEDGACLLVGIEYNGKTGKEIAFLNWELIDLSRLPVHLATVFDASQTDTHPPGTVLTDGRKGRD